MTDITYRLQKTPQENVGMETAETLKAENYIKGKQKMLEWGSGGSTLYFPSLVKKYVSIEHDRFWYDKIKPDIKDNVEYYYVPPHEEKFDVDLDTNAFDILKGSDNFYNHDYNYLNSNDFLLTIQWEQNGRTTKINKKDGKVYWKTRGGFDWHCGIDYIKKPLELTHRDYDVILVDGRCRSMCAYISQQLLKDDGYLMIHDFNHRKYYHGILKYYDIVDSVESLVILHKK
jgi:hypothetical protein